MADFPLQPRLSGALGLHMIKALLAASASKDLGLESRKRALGFADCLIPKDNALELEVVHRRSVFMRMTGDIEGSQEVIEACLAKHSQHTVTSESSSYTITALYHSQANNYAYCFKFKEARATLRHWSPLEIKSQEQNNLLWDRMMCVGRITRGEGYFEAARRCFKACTETPFLPKNKRLMAVSALADAHCELAAAGRPYELPNKTQHDYLNEAEALVSPEIEPIRRSGQHGKGFRRLLLSLIEIKILQHDLSAAFLLTQEVLAKYEGLQDPDIIDRLGHIRALIASARLSPTGTAGGAWDKVLKVGYAHNPGEEVFTCGVVRLFLGTACANLGNIELAHAHYLCANNIFQTQKPQFLIPGIGTYLFRCAREGWNETFL